MSKLETKKGKNVYLTVIFFSALFLFTIFPLLKFKYPVLVDYPNHLASYFIQANIDNDFWLKENYKVEWHIKPYLIIEGLGGILARYMNIYLAGKVLLILGMFFIYSGALFLRKAVCGRIDLWMATSILFIYNLVLAFGWVNYYISAGIALIFMGVWIKLRKTQLFINILLFSILSIFLFFCHLFALFIYAVFVISYEFGVYKYSREEYFISNLTKTLAQFILPVVIFFIFNNNLVDISGGAYYIYGGFFEKVFALLSSIICDYNKYILFAVLVMVCSVFIIRLFFHCRVQIYDSMKLPLISILIIIIIMPKSLAGVWGIDLRFPFVFMILLLASIKLNNNEKNTINFIRSILLVSLLTTCFKIYFINDKWERIGLQYQEFQNSMQNIDFGAKVLTIQKNPKNLKGFDQNIYHYLSALAVIERSCFWPNLFTSDLTPIFPTVETKFIDSPASIPLSLDNLLDKNAKNGVYYGPGMIVYWENWTHDFDYLISIRFEDLSIIDLKNLKLKFRGSFFDIYQIVH
jgi:hypothetical protein